MRLLILKAGDTVGAIIERHGDFDRMFEAPIAGLDLEIQVVPVHRGDPLPDIGAVEAVIITGSPSSVTKREPWADALARYTSDLVDAGRPLLGVCYGHQILAHARGGRVEQNPLGYEIGTIDLEITGAGRADPLIGSLRGPMRFQSVHADAVVSLPEEAQLLATSERSAVQAFSIGDRTWGVQFHPEMTRSIMSMYVDARIENVRADALRSREDPEARLAAVRRSITDTPSGPELLIRFIALAKEKLG
jgi:GMP synthase (glutamine-hydrolysing)